MKPIALTPRVLASLLALSLSLPSPAGACPEPSRRALRVSQEGTGLEELQRAFTPSAGLEESREKANRALQVAVSTNLFQLPKEFLSRSQEALEAVRATPYRTLLSSRDAAFVSAQLDKLEFLLRHLQGEADRGEILNFRKSLREFHQQWLALPLKKEEETEKPPAPAQAPVPSRHFEPPPTLKKDKGIGRLLPILLAALLGTPEYEEKKPPDRPAAGLEENDQAPLQETMAQLKRRLFNLEPPSMARSMEQMARQLVAAHPEVPYVPMAEMPQAIERLFAKMDLKPKQRLLEVGPGSDGGVGLIAALKGLQVVVVESSRPFQVDLRRLREELASMGSQQARQLDSLLATQRFAMVNMLEKFQEAVAPYQELIRWADGSLTVIPGDFAAKEIQQRVKELGPFDHVVATDVIDPAGGRYATNLTATTTAEEPRVKAILDGLAQVASQAKDLYVSFIGPEEGPNRPNVFRTFQTLEQFLQARNLPTTEYDRMPSPSSGGILSARLYRLTAGLEEVSKEFLAYERTLAERINREEVFRIELQEDGLIRRLALAHGEVLYDSQQRLSSPDSPLKMTLGQVLRPILLAYAPDSGLLALNINFQQLMYFSPEEGPTYLEPKGLKTEAEPQFRDFMDTLEKAGGATRMDFPRQGRERSGLLPSVPILENEMRIELANSQGVARIILAPSGNWIVSLLRAGLEEQVQWQKGLRELTIERPMALLHTSFPETVTEGAFEVDAATTDRLLEVLRNQVKQADAVGFLPSLWEAQGKADLQEVRWVSLEALPGNSFEEHLGLAASLVLKELVLTWLKNNRGSTHFDVDLARYVDLQGGRGTMVYLRGRPPMYGGGRNYPLNEMKGNIGKQINGSLNYFLWGLDLKLQFDAPIGMPPPRRYRKALVEGAKGEWWIHLHMPSPPRGGGNGLLFRLLLRDGKIIGVTDPMAELGTSEFVTLEPPYVFKGRLTRLIQAAEREVMSVEVARSLESAIRKNRPGMFLWESKEPDGKKLYMIWTKAQINVGFERVVNESSGRVYRSLSRPTTAGLEENPMDQRIDEAQQLMYQGQMKEAVLEILETLEDIALDGGLEFTRLEDARLLLIQADQALDLKAVLGSLVGYYLQWLEDPPYRKLIPLDRAILDKTLNSYRDTNEGLLPSQFLRQYWLEESTAGLEETGTAQTEHVRRMAIQDQIQSTLRDLTQLGFTVQILDQNLVKEFRELAVLAELSQGKILIDASQDLEETSGLVAKLVSRDIRRVDSYGDSERALRFEKIAESAFIRVDRHTLGQKLLLQLLANLSELSPEAVAKRVDIEKLAAWLEEEA